MSSAAPRPSPAGRHALIAPRGGRRLRDAARRTITVAPFHARVRRTAEALPAGRHVLIFCADRYRFAVASVRP